MITLGIIGVVAALTLPTLINKQQEKVLESQYKKSRNIVSNGYRLMLAKNEVFEIKDLPMWDECYRSSSSVDYECANKHHKEYFKMVQTNTYNATPWSEYEYQITGQEKKLRPWDDNNFIFSTTDGMIYELLDLAPDYTSFSVIADVNGPKNPNTVKKDLYKFKISNNGKVSDITDDFEKDCSVENPAGCTTPEACYAADECNGCDDTLIKGTYWSGGSCHVTSCACPE